MTLFRLNRHPEELLHLHENEPELYKALLSKDCLIEISSSIQPYDVVIGVPHQTAIGIGYIAENNHKRVSDEGAAFYALVIFTTLANLGIPNKIVIAAHDTQYDPNKEPNSSYWKAIFFDKMRLLLECHGSKDREIDLEVSSGTNSLGKPSVFGHILAKELNYQYSLIAQENAKSNEGMQIEISEDKPTKLKYAALSTKSLTEAGDRCIPAFHIEATPKFRIPENKSNNLTTDGLILGQAIGNALSKYFTETDKG